MSDTNPTSTSNGPGSINTSIIGNFNNANLSSAEIKISDVKNSEIKSVKADKSERKVPKFDSSQNKKDIGTKNANLDNIVNLLDVKQITGDDVKFTDKAFVVVGNVDAGKSTLIGTLTTDLLDDGRGSARQTVAKHKHEIDSGRTSDISVRSLKFANGKNCVIIDLCGHEKYFTTTATGISGMWPDYAIIVVSPSRGILPMTKQHFKMIMSYNIPAIFVVTRIDSAEEASCKDVTKSITDLCELYRRKPAFMNDYYKYHSYINGSDLYKKYDLSTKLKNVSITDYPSLFKDMSLKQSDINDILTFINFDTFKINIINETIKGLKMVDGKQNYIPAIYVSNVDGYCLDVVKQSMMFVDPRDFWNNHNSDNTNTIVKFFRKKLNIPDLGLNNEHKGSTFYIDSVYNVKGVGIVVTGINRGDDISINDELFMGPINKSFIKIKVKSIHNNNREDVPTIGDHHRGCLAIKSIKDVLKRNQIPKGTVIISDQSMLKNMCFRFDAAITIFGGHSATLRSGYSPVLHAGNIRQASRLILNDEKLSPQETKELESLSKKDRKERQQKKIKSGDVEKVSFKFISRPEYLDPGTVFVFRSGEIHGVGCVIKTYQIDQNNQYDQPDPVKHKRRVKRIRRSDLVVVKSSNSANSVSDSTSNLNTK